MTETINSPQEEANHWHEFTETIKDRLRKPCKHPTFVMYFVGIIVVVGGFGLLEPIVSCFVFGSLPSSQLPNVLISAGYTYFVAIAATAAVDLILSYHQRKFLLMFFLVCALVVILCATFAAIFSTISGRPVVAAIPSVIGYFLALFLWWIGNANNAHLLDTPVQPTAATGGDAETKPTGDLTGFNT